MWQDEHESPFVPKTGLVYNFLPILTPSAVIRLYLGFFIGINEGKLLGIIYVGSYFPKKV
jgi:hypothetical protein